MFPIRFLALADEIVQAYRNGSPDAHGRAPERAINESPGAPCRHCLKDIRVGEPLLILAHRPFTSSQAYAESGPIFLHAENCERHPESARTPAMLLKRERVLIRGYNRNDRIVYGTGAVIASGEIEAAAAKLFQRKEVAYIHLRSANYNCYQCAVFRA